MKEGERLLDLFLLLVVLFVFVAVVDHDAAEIVDGLEELLEPVVPLGGGLEEEHDALVGEAELEVAGLADVVDEVLGVLKFLGFVVGVDVVAELFEEQGNVGLFEHDLAHGDEGAVGCLGVFDEVLPAIGIVLFKQDGGNFFGDVAVEAPHAMTGDKRDHVVFKRDKVIGLHQGIIVAETGE